MYFLSDSHFCLWFTWSLGTFSNHSTSKNVESTELIQKGRKKRNSVYFSIATLVVSVSRALNSLYGAFPVH